MIVWECHLGDAFQGLTCFFMSSSLVWTPERKTSARVRLVISTLMLKITKQDNVTFSSPWSSLSACRGLFFSNDRLIGTWQMLFSPHRNSSGLSGESVRSDFSHALRLRKGQKLPEQSSQMDQQRRSRWSGPSPPCVSNWTPLISSFPPAEDGGSQTHTFLFHSSFLVCFLACMFKNVRRALSSWEWKTLTGQSSAAPPAAGSSSIIAQW